MSQTPNKDQAARLLERALLLIDILDNELALASELIFKISEARAKDIDFRIRPRIVGRADDIQYILDEMKGE